MHRWLLPEAIEDILPAEAWHVETLRRRLLDEFRLHGYEFVMPPLLEYIESLLIANGYDLDLRTFKLVDQLSGRTLGVRADMTPQVARIDAHLLNRKGVTRLCYCGSVLHTLPADLTASREPLQIGVELYGHGGAEADVEVIRLLVRALQIAGIDGGSIGIDLGHVGIFRALVAAAELDSELERELFEVLKAKDIPGLRELMNGKAAIAEPYRSAFLALPECYGDFTALDAAAARLPALPEIAKAFVELRSLAGSIQDLPVSFDLADLRGYHYHSGVVFAAYCGGHPGAIALGGRYDQVGKVFGRSRAATGFSMDLRELSRLAPQSVARGAILAPCVATDDAALQQAIAGLRDAGEVVVVALPGHPADWGETGCDRQLVLRDERWQVELLDNR